MTCRNARKYISRRLDGELGAGQEARLEGHLGSCPDCRALAEEFRRIADAAARLDSPEPSSDGWARIKTKLVALEENPTAVKRPSLPRPAPWLGVPALRFAGVAAAALVLVAGGVYIGLRLGRPGTAVGPRDSEKVTLAKLDEAERYCQKAIRALSEAFVAQRGALPPQVVEFFERNLGAVDATIQACRAAVQAEPDDLQARNFILAAYMEKVSLLDSALDVQRKGRDAAGKGKIL